MLKEFYKRAREIIKQHAPDIESRVENGTMLYLKAENVDFRNVAKLCDAFERERFTFAVEKEKDDFIQVLQPVIPYVEGMAYGYIPEENKPGTEY